jgi:esterase/lipase superfamily enzyme
MPSPRPVASAPPHRWRRPLAALVSASLLAGCGARGEIGYDPTAAAVGTVETIVVATDRAPAPGGLSFTNQRASAPSFARFRVSVPPERAVGEVGFPESDPPDPLTDFLTVGVDRLDGEKGFIAAVDGELRHKGSNGDVTLFVHGYNNTFAEALYRQAQLVHDYGGRAAQVQFSWPSAGTATGYGYDRESVMYSRDSLERVLRDLTRTRAKSINLVAHSMGTFLLMDTLWSMAKAGDRDFFRSVNAVILLSPDIDIDVFRREALPVIRTGVPVFVVVSTRDKALLISAKLRGENERVGSIDSPSDLGDIDVTVIDLSGIDAGGDMGHFPLAHSPDLINMLGGMMQSGQDVLATPRQRGIIGTSVAILKEGTEMVLSPLAP